MGEKPRCWVCVVDRYYFSLQGQARKIQKPKCAQRIREENVKSCPHLSSPHPALSPSCLPHAHRRTSKTTKKPPTPTGPEVSPLSASPPTALQPVFFRTFCLTLQKREKMMSWSRRGGVGVPRTSPIKTFSRRSTKSSAMSVEPSEVAGRPATEAPSFFVFSEGEGGVFLLAP